MSARDAAEAPADSDAIVGQLQRLIEAIDRRAPHPERPSEVAIARDAADLRHRAVTLMRSITEAGETSRHQR